MKNIYIMGNLNLDINIELDKFPTKGETVRGRHLVTRPGGKALNQSCTAAHFGAQVSVLSSVANDLYGINIIEHLKFNKVNTDFVKMINDTATGIAFLAKNDKDKEIIKTEGTSKYMYEEDVDAFLEPASEGDLLLVNLEFPLPVVQYAIKLANEKKLVVVFNPSPAIEEAIDFLPSCDYVILNERELLVLTGIMEIEKASNFLKSLNTIVTLGEKGVYFPDENVKFDALFKDEVIDNSGAGDVFMGSFAFMIANGSKPIEAIDFARAVASYSCTKATISENLLSKEEALTLIKREDLI
ncbi:MAG: ribokinase [Gammaproteobacteria bacterium]|nr:ribokinase [Gammaproteobacteria bacterium]